MSGGSGIVAIREAGRLLETDHSKREIVIDIIAAGKGNRRDRRIYRPDVLEAGSGAFTGAQMYANHLLPADEARLAGMPRDIRDLTGRVKESWWNPSGGREGKGAIQGLATVPAGWLWEMIVNDPELLGVSINALGTTNRTPDGDFLVESITGVHSVDWVARSGAGGRVADFVEGWVAEHPADGAYGDAFEGVGAQNGLQPPGSAEDYLGVRNSLRLPGGAPDALPASGGSQASHLGEAGEVGIAAGSTGAGVERASEGEGGSVGTDSHTSTSGDDASRFAAHGSAAIPPGGGAVGAHTHTQNRTHSTSDLVGTESTTTGPSGRPSLVGTTGTSGPQVQTGTITIAVPDSHADEAQRKPREEEVVPLTIEELKRDHPELVAEIEEDFARRQIEELSDEELSALVDELRKESEPDEPDEPKAESDEDEDEENEVEIETPEEEVKTEEKEPVGVTEADIESLKRDYDRKLKEAEARIEAKYESKAKVRENRAFASEILMESGLPPLSQAAIQREFHDFSGSEESLKEQLVAAIRSKRGELAQATRRGVKGHGMSSKLSESAPEPVESTHHSAFMADMGLDPTERLVG